MSLNKSTLFAAIATVVVNLPAIAGDDESKRRDSAQSSSRQQSSRSSDQSSDRNANLKVSPTGWIRMAVDYDNDGYFDAVETIYTYDLERARKSSRERANQDARQMSSSDKSSSDRSQSNRASDRRASSSRSQQQQETLSGSILEMRSERLLGMDEPSVIARIRTDENKPAKVVLGPKSTVNKLDLQEGDKIAVRGVKGRVNDQAMLLANAISDGDQKVAVALPSSRGAKRVRAELLDWRTTKFRGHEGEFVVAKVKCNSGKQAVVNLGAKTKIDQLNLEKGDEIRMIVRPATMNNRKGMVADEVFANGKSVNVSPPKMVSRSDRQSDSQSSDSRSSDSQQSGSQNDRTRDLDQASNRSSRNPTQQQQASTQRSQQSQGDQGKQGNQRKQDSESASNKPALGIAVRNTDQGVVILAIHPASPAADKDLELGDQIVSINGNKIESANDVVNLIAERAPDDKVELKTRRDDDEQTVSIRLTSLQKLMSTFR